MAREDDDVEQLSNGLSRISVSVDADTRKAIRIAAAIEDLTLGQWVNRVLERAADVAIPEDVKAAMKLKAKRRKARAAK